MTPEEAKEVVGGFLTDAKRKVHKEWEMALYKIARLPWWQSWQANDIAAEALGIGKYCKYPSPKKGLKK